MINSSIIFALLGFDGRKCGGHAQVHAGTEAKSRDCRKVTPICSGTDLIRGWPAKLGRYEHQ